MTRANIVDDAFWTVGDAELISSDNVRFKISLERLSSDLMWPPKGSTRSYTFKHPQFETAPVIRAALEAEMAASRMDEPTYTYRVPPAFPRNIYPILVLLRFLVEWKCVRGFDNFVDALIEYLRDCQLGWPKRYFTFLRRLWKDDRRKLEEMIPMFAGVCVERQKQDERMSMIKQWRREMGEAQAAENEKVAEAEPVAQETAKDGQDNEKTEPWDEDSDEEQYEERTGFA